MRDCYWNLVRRAGLVKDVVAVVYAHFRFTRQQCAKGQELLPGLLLGTTKN